MLLKKKKLDHCIMQFQEFDWPLYKPLYHSREIATSKLVGCALKGNHQDLAIFLDCLS